MAGLYVDTSALGRVLLDEPDTETILLELGRYDEQVSSRLLAVELLRVAMREGLVEQADQLLSGVALLPLDEAVLAAAETISPASVATLDAIHLVTALRVAAGQHVEALMTYDSRLADGARQHGLVVVAPEP